MTTNDKQDVIVCATDLGESAENAVLWASALARSWGGRIQLLHVLPQPTTSLEALATDAAVLETARFTEALARLQAQARALESRTGVPVQARVLQGETHNAIAAAAEDERAKLIVIAARRHTLVGRWLLGSTAERTVRAARCPVAVIPPPGEASGEAVARAGDPARPLRVLVGVDLGPASVRAVELVDELRRSRPCQVTLVHLYWPPDEFDRLGLRGPRELADPDPDVVRDLDARLRQRLGPAVGGPGMKLVIRPAWGGPVANLLLAAGEDGCDLLVVGADERHGLARITQPTVARALAGRPGPVPVICVPAPQGAAEAAVPAALPRLLTVLAPTDLSRTGNRAVAYAYALLRAQGGVVELCHVHERPLPVPAYVYEEKKGRLGPGQRTALEAELRALIPAEAERLGITTHVSIIDGGEAATAIVQASERLAVDAIALGSHGHGIAARALLGSVADKVVRHAHRPVLVVRAG